MRYKNFRIYSTELPAELQILASRPGSPKLPDLSHLETSFRKIVAEVLRLDENFISLDTRFVSIGMESIGALEVVMSMEKLLGVIIPLRLVLANNHSISTLSLTLRRSAET